MLHEIFKRTQDYYGIKGKELAETASISAQHISEFRRGKTDMSVSKFWDALQALERLAPGSLKFFCQEICSEFEGGKQSLGEKLFWLIEAADDEEIDQMMLAIAHRIKSKSKGHNLGTLVP